MNSALPVVCPRSQVSSVCASQSPACGAFHGWSTATSVAIWASWVTGGGGCGGGRGGGSAGPHAGARGPGAERRVARVLLAAPVAADEHVVAGVVGREEPDADLARERLDVVLGRPGERPAELGVASGREGVAEHAPADAVARLEHD